MPDAYYQQTGYITFVVNADEFADASPTNPHYIRLRVDKGATLSRTLVDNMTKGPINLALGIRSGHYQINAADDAVSIVRWRAGEQSIWLKVTDSSSDWVDDQGTLGPPTFDVLVQFTIGQSGQESATSNAVNYRQGRANLPANSDLNGNAADTQIEVDTINSLLVFLHPVFGILNFDPSAWVDSTGVETAVTEQNINNGVFAPVLFSGDDFIGRPWPALPFERRIPFVADGHRFSTHLLITNNGTSAAEVVLKPYESDGDAIVPAVVTLPANSNKTVSLDSLFPGEDIAQITITANDDTVVTAEYQPRRLNNGASAFMNEMNVSGKELSFPLQAGRSTQEVLAAVPLGPLPSDLQAEFFDANGASLGQTTLASILEPMEHQVIQMDSLIPNGTASVKLTSTDDFAAAMFRVRTNGTSFIIPVQPVQAASVQ